MSSKAKRDRLPRVDSRTLTAALGIRQKRGGYIFTEHHGMELTDVYAAVIPDFPYHAGVHVDYQEAKLRIKDGLPKMKDVPKVMGGSGLRLAE